MKRADKREKLKSVLQKSNSGIIWDGLGFVLTFQTEKTLWAANGAKSDEHGTAITTYTHHFLSLLSERECAEPCETHKLFSVVRATDKQVVLAINIPL